MTIKKYTPYIIIFYVLAAAALVCASIFDLKIDIWLNNPEDPFAIWFRNTGEIPARLVLPLAGAVFIKTCEKPFERFCGYIVLFGGGMYLGFHLVSYFLFKNGNAHIEGEAVNIAYGLVYGIGCSVIILLVLPHINIPKRMVRPLRTIALLGIILMFVHVGIVEGTKIIWGRVRFRDLLAAGSYDAFTPWYHPNGITGNKSFPSGHTGSAGMSYLMMFMPYISKKYEKKTALCFILPLVYTSIVAFTRLVMGAHYLSDVTAGGVIAFTVVIIGIAIYEKRLMKR